MLGRKGVRTWLGVSPLLDVKKRLESVATLPSMSPMAERLLQLKENPRAGAESLAELISLDPSLSAQVMRYANAPLFSYRGEVATVRDAVIRVLGYDPAFNLVLGLALGGEFKVPPDGPIGLGALWQHAVYAAALAQALAREMPADRCPNVGTVYLAGLLQNVGLLLLGHLFRSEYLMLSKIVHAHPAKPITEIEALVLGVQHAQVGARLLSHWRLPAAICTAVNEHHHSDYLGEHQVFVHLVQLANLLLAARGIGDSAPCDIAAQYYARLGLVPARAELAVERVLAAAPQLDAMVRAAAA